MLGSLSQLGKQGTAWYASEWVRCRNVLKWELGEVLVTPLIPLQVTEKPGRVHGLGGWPAGIRDDVFEGDQVRVRERDPGGGGGEGQVGG